MKAERARVEKCKFGVRQRAALHYLYDLFEAGKWQECLALLSDKNAFPYNEEGGYPEIEHVGTAVMDVLQDLPDHTYFTNDQIGDPNFET